MVESAVKTIAPEVGAQRVVADLEGVRARTHGLVAHLDARDLERQHSPIMSPLAWDLAHIAAYEDLWLAHRHAGMPLLHPELADLYDAFETPRAVRGELELLDAPAAFSYMAAVRERVIAATEREGVGDGTLHEMVLRHELQHTETMLQTMALAGLLPPGQRDGRRLSPSQLEEPPWIDVEAGAFELGAPPGIFAYDNERERHAVQLDAFRIARLPVSNSQWRTFCDQGGYERREWWSQAGWAWREHAEPARDPRAGVGADQEPVCHVNFHEAQAFASAHGARLPTEAEWERAARAEGRPLAAVGEVWEWTASEFGAYPGFVAHPYREYSEVFFDRGYRVLRGGSWASDGRVATRTFRNWDLPQRRQIFAGVRLASDLLASDP
jgi:gamma-glutamyl hercynylcysteine S-oxide synthase